MEFNFHQTTDEGFNILTVINICGTLCASDEFERREEERSMRGKQSDSTFATDARRFHALADANRLAILCALQHGELCACELLDDLQISQPTLSHHMKLLIDSGLVSGRKEGRWMYYSITAKNAKLFREMMASYARCDCETDASVVCSAPTPCARCTSMD